MKKLIPLSLVLLLLAGVGTSQAQTAEQPFNFSVDFGTHSYNGDLGNEVLEFTDSDYTYGIGLAAYLGSAFDLALKAKVMKLDRTNGPNDSVFSQRNTSFEADNFNLNLMLRWKFLFSNTDLNPYLAAGAGVNFLQFENGVREDENVTYFGLPLGGGFNFEVSETLTLNVEAIYNRTFEDGIDSYPLSDEDAVFDASDRSDLDDVDHDDFLTTSLGFTFNFGGEDDEDNLEERLLRQSMKNLEAAQQSSDEASATLRQAQQLNDETLAALEDLRNAMKQDKDENDDLKAEMVRIVNNVQFEFDKSDIIEPAMDELNSLANIMQTYPKLSIDIAAHADERGSDSYNDKLSMRRAQAVKDYLTGRGVNSSRISTSALGENSPLMSGNSETAYAQNRAVHLTLSYNGGNDQMMEDDSMDDDSMEDDGGN